MQWLGLAPEDKAVLTVALEGVAGAVPTPLAALTRDHLYVAATPAWLSGLSSQQQLLLQHLASHLGPKVGVWGVGDGRHKDWRSRVPAPDVELNAHRGALKPASSRAPASRAWWRVRCVLPRPCGAQGGAWGAHSEAQVHVSAERGAPEQAMRLVMVLLPEGEAPGSADLE